MMMSVADREGGELPGLRVVVRINEFLAEHDDETVSMEPTNRES